MIDLRRIDGRLVEEVVNDFQKELDGPMRDKLLVSIIRHFSVFSGSWARVFAQYGHDTEMYNRIILESAENFVQRAKPDGLAFNKHVVSALLDHVKNLNADQLENLRAAKKIVKAVRNTLQAKSILDEMMGDRHD